MQKHSKGRIQNAEQIAKVIALRKAGASFEQIGAQFGFTAQNAYRIVSEHLDRTAKQTRENVEQIRTMELDRLDALLMGQWNQAKSGHQGATATVLRIMERRARLLGLDMPTKVASTNPEGTEGAPFVVKLPEDWGTVTKPADGPETSDSAPA